MFGLKLETGPIREVEVLYYNPLEIGTTFRWGVAVPGFVDDCGTGIPTVIDLEWTIVAIHDHQNEGLVTGHPDDMIIVAKAAPHSEVVPFVGLTELPELRMICRILSPWGSRVKMRRLFLWKEEESMSQLTSKFIQLHRQANPAAT